MHTKKIFPQGLEDESIYIIREIAGQFEKPCLLFSGGKDSIVLVHLALKAFYPAKIPFPLMHIDTGHNFPEAIVFRDKLAEKHALSLIVRNVEDTIKKKNLKEETGKYASRNRLQTFTLLDSIEEFQFDACIGGARRDEEKARAKERIFSVRDDFGQWDAKMQRPEVYNFLNGRIHKGENVRAFPISNWTELDVWNYILREKIELPNLYFSHERKIFRRDGLIWADSEFVHKESADVVKNEIVRFRTVGDMTCTAAVASKSQNVNDIIDELLLSEISERGARIDDKMSESAMEERKQSGYF